MTFQCNSAAKTFNILLGYKEREIWGINRERICLCTKITIRMLCSLLCSDVKNMDILQKWPMGWGKHFPTWNLRNLIYTAYWRGGWDVTWLLLRGYLNMAKKSESVYGVGAVLLTRHNKGPVVGSEKWFCPADFVWNISDWLELEVGYWLGWNNALRYKESLLFGYVSAMPCRDTQAKSKQARS